MIAAYVMTVRFQGSSALMTYQLPTAIPTAVAGCARCGGRSGMLGECWKTDISDVTISAIILANIFVTFPLVLESLTCI